MNPIEPLIEFKEGLAALQNGYSHAAVVHLQKAVEHDNHNPFYLSFYGLALAKSEHNWAKAEANCLAALKMKCNSARLYLNLAEVYRQAGELEDALYTLYNGLQFTKWDARLVQALQQLGIRRTPVLSFLDRKNLLNRQLGKLRHRLESHSNVSTVERLRMGRS